jgi:hypothetical protein
VLPTILMFTTMTTFSAGAVTTHIFRQKLNFPEDHSVSSEGSLIWTQQQIIQISASPFFIKK